MQFSKNLATEHKQCVIMLQCSDV